MSKITAAITTIALKALAFFLTGSVGLLSDAVESIVNLVAAIVALFALPYPNCLRIKNTRMDTRRQNIFRVLQKVYVF